MKPLLIGLCVALLAVPVVAEPGTARQIQTKAQWALNYIGTTKNPAQKARYVADINEYAWLMQDFLGQKKAPVQGEPWVFIDRLEKLVVAKQEQQRRIAELERQQRLGNGVINESDDFAAEQRLRRLENEVETQRIRAREAAEQQAAAARREAYRKGVMGR